MKFRKKPVLIEAVQWRGDNDIEVCDFTGIRLFAGNKLVIPTLEGALEAEVGDYIIRGVNGEVYPCKPEIFRETYEVAE